MKGIKKADIISEIEKVGGIDKVILKELVKVAKAKVKVYSASDKLRAIELIARIKGWLRDDGLSVQQNILFQILGDDVKMERYIEEDEEVKREIYGECEEVSK